MATDPKDGLTQLLRAWQAGDESALERVVPVVYPELRRLAQRYMHGERIGHTLQTTAGERGLPSAFSWPWTKHYQVWRRSIRRGPDSSNYGFFWRPFAARSCRGARDHRRRSALELAPGQSLAGTRVRQGGAAWRLRIVGDD
jgi:hypothetical protein